MASGVDAVYTVYHTVGMETRTVKLVRVDDEVYRRLRDEQRPRESYNDVLRRLLGMGENATPPRTEGGAA